MMLHKNKISLALLLAFIAVPAVCLCALAAQNSSSGQTTELASRYQLRNRTPSFFERSKTSPGSYRTAHRSMRV
jgi:hypothetical protein